MRGRGQGPSHHVNLEQQQLQPIAPAQVPQAVMDVAGVEVVVPQAGGGHKRDRVTPRGPPGTPRSPHSPQEEGAGALAQHIVGDDITELPRDIADELQDRVAPL